jgi:uroporphyrinogen-III synthase
MAAPEARPLTGVRVLVTRPQHQAGRLTELIERDGGEAIVFPVIEIADPADTAVLARVIDRIDDFDFAIFISANAATRAMNLLRARRPELPPRLRLAAVGRTSAHELERFHAGPVLVPRGRFDSEALLDLPELRDVQGKRIVIFRGEGGRELLADTLTARGACVEYAECYRRVRPDTDVGPLLARWARGEIDVAVVTSVEGLRNLYDMLGKPGSRWLVKTPLVVVSERVADAARELGFTHASMVAPAAGDDAVLETLRAWRARQNPL